MRGDEQEPDMRCGTLGTRGHVTSEVLHSPIVTDWRVRRLIRCYLQAGMRAGETQRTRGYSLTQIIKELGTYLKGWLQYYGIARRRTTFYGLQALICRRLRCYLWKQWGRAGYRELCKRGVSRDLAWNTSKSAHGPWRISRSPALGIALPTRYFASLGLPLLYGN